MTESLAGRNASGGASEETTSAKPKWTAPTLIVLGDAAALTGAGGAASADFDGSS